MGSSIRRLAAIVMVAAGAAAGQQADEAKLREALVAYVQAGPKQEQAALKKAVGVAKNDFGALKNVLARWQPLSKAAPGKTLEVTFASSGHDWTYSIRVPESYDGRKRFPVLVLPDHAMVDAKAGIAFWEHDPAVETCILFRPVIAKFKEDKKRFPDQQFFAIDQAMAEVMGAALTHLRLNFAVDPAGFVMTGLSQAGYYTWYYGVSFPDQFAALIPESAGGVSVRAAVRPLAANLAHVRVRILHARGDTICPFADAEAMHAALTGSGTAAAERELIVYEDADWGGTPPPARHPGPHHLRRENVFALIGAAKRTIPSSLERVLRYRQQGHEGGWRVEPPSDPTKPLNVKLAEDGGTLTASGADAVYLVPLEDFLAKKTYRAGGLEMRTKGDMTAAMTAFKRTGDPARVHAAEIRVAETK